MECRLGVQARLQVGVQGLEVLLADAQGLLGGAERLLGRLQQLLRHRLQAEAGGAVDELLGLRGWGEATAEGGRGLGMSRA